MEDRQNYLSSQRILVIVPVYNESANILFALDDLKQHVPEVDLLVVNDASTDDTALIAGKNGVKVLSLPINLGVGGAMKLGYIFACQNNYDIAVQFDGDAQHRADQIIDLLKPIKDGQVDLVVGSRILHGTSFKFHPLRFFGSRILSVLVSLIIAQKVTDPTSGFRAASRKMIGFFAEHYPQTYLADTTEALAWAGRHGMKIIEVPTSMRQRQAGKSAAGNITGMGHMIRIVLALLVDSIKPKFK